MKLNRSHVILIVCWLTWFWSGCCGGIITALFPAIQESLSVSTSAIALLISATSLGSTVSFLSSGFISERFGTRRIIIVGVLISLFCLVTISLSTDYLYILITRSVLGFSISLYLPAGLSILSELFPQEKRGRYIGIHEMAPPAANTIGPIFAGLMLSLGLNWNDALELWVIPTIIVFVLQVVFVRGVESKEEKEVSANEHNQSNEVLRKGYLPSAWPVKNLLLLILAQILRGVAVAEITLMPVYWVTNFGVVASTAAFVFGMVRICAVFGQVGAGYLSDIMGRMKVLNLLQIFASLLLIPSSYLPFGSLLFISLSIFNILSAGYMPVVFTLMSETCQSSADRAKIIGIVMACQGLAGTINPAILGLLADKFSYGVAWIYPITAGLLAVPTLVFAARSIKIIK